MSIQVSLSAKEIYEKLCPECKEAMEKLLADRVSKEMVKELLEGEDSG